MHLCSKSSLTELRRFAFETHIMAPVYLLILNISLVIKPRTEKKGLFYLIQASKYLSLQMQAL